MRKLGTTETRWDKCLRRRVPLLTGSAARDCLTLGSGTTRLPPLSRTEAQYGGPKNQSGRVEKRDPAGNQQGSEETCRAGETGSRQAPRNPTATPSTQGVRRDYFRLLYHGPVNLLIGAPAPLARFTVDDAKTPKSPHNRVLPPLALLGLLLVRRTTYF